MHSHAIELYVVVFHLRDKRGRESESVLQIVAYLHLTRDGSYCFKISFHITLGHSAFWKAMRSSPLSR